MADLMPSGHYEPEPPDTMELRIDGRPVGGRVVLEALELTVTRFVAPALEQILPGLDSRTIVLVVHPDDMRRWLGTLHQVWLALALDAGLGTVVCFDGVELRPDLGMSRRHYAALAPCSGCDAHGRVHQVGAGVWVRCPVCRGSGEESLPEANGQGRAA